MQKMLSSLFSVIFIAFLILGIVLPFILPLDPDAQNILAPNLEPIWGETGQMPHLLGTDILGRDVFTRVIYGLRTSIFIGLLVVLIGGTIGVTLGTLAGYFGGLLEQAISFIITVRLALPIILVALAVVALVGTSLYTLIAILGLLLWERYALVTKAMVASLREAEFVVAARVIGCSHLRILCKEILPNLLKNIIIIASLDASLAITLEASLSYLGLGVPLSVSSLGLMIADGREEILFNPRLIIIPSIVLFFLVLSINQTGQRLHQWFQERSL